MSGHGGEAAIHRGLCKCCQSPARSVGKPRPQIQVRWRYGSAKLSQSASQQALTSAGRSLNVMCATVPRSRRGNSIRRRRTLNNGGSMSSNSSSPVDEKDFLTEDSAGVPVLTVTAELPVGETERADAVDAAAEASNGHRPDDAPPVAESAAGSSAAAIPRAAATTPASGAHVRRAADEARRRRARLHLDGGAGAKQRRGSQRPGGRGRGERRRAFTLQHPRARGRARGQHGNRRPRGRRLATTCHPTC